MKRSVMITALVALLAGVGVAQIWDKKPYTEWREREAKRILENSPWVVSFQQGSIGQIGGNVLQGDTQLASEREYLVIARIGLFSARPMRQAFVVQATQGDKGRMENLTEFATRPITDEVIVNWVLASRPPGVKALSNLLHELNSLGTAELSTKVFLATNTGKKVFLKEYIPPTADGTGAKFIFPRTTETGEPLLTPADRTLRFQSDREFRFGERVVTVDATFRVDRLMMNGQLEY